MAAGAVMPSSWPVWEVFLYNWQALIAGVAALIAGFLAWRGARGQITDAQAARDENDQRRLMVIRWTIEAEGRRLGAAAADMMAIGAPLVSGRGPRPNEPLAIETSRLLRGEREEIALLDDEARGLLKLTAQTLDAYNLRIKRQPHGEGTTSLLQQLAKLREVGGDDGRTDPDT